MTVSRDVGREGRRFRRHSLQAVSVTGDDVQYRARRYPSLGLLYVEDARDG